MDDTMSVPKPSNCDVLSVFGQKRLLSDIKTIMRDKELNKNGIYYRHDELNMQKGYAMIIGPTDTVYQHGAYLFEINFPGNYPYDPPLVKYKTNDGNVRFHPNLYKNEKVCLSILNTWRGEPWSSSLTLSTVLLTIMSILTNDPLLHEPGITKNHRDCETYSKIIEFKNLEFSVLKFADVKCNYYPVEYKPFHSIYLDYIKENRRKILQLIIKDRELATYSTGVYRMNVKIDNKVLIDTFNKTISDEPFYS